MHNRQTIFDILRDVQPAPGVQFKTAPRDREEPEPIETDPDVRLSSK